MDAGKENAPPASAAATDKAARDGMVELQQILKSYGDFERCDRWNRESAPIDEEGVLAALERVPLDAGKLGSGGRAAATKTQLVRAAILSGHARALRRLLEMGCSPNGEGALVCVAGGPVLDVTDELNAEDWDSVPEPVDITNQPPIVTQGERMGALNAFMARLNSDEAAAMRKVGAQWAAGAEAFAAAQARTASDASLNINPLAKDTPNPRGDSAALKSLAAAQARTDALAASGVALSDEQPLVTAVHQLAYACVEVLLEFGADPNAGPARRAKPLVACASLVHETAQDEAVAVCELLLKAGADVDGLDGAVSATAAAHCARAGCDKVLATVVDAGADLELAVRDSLRRGDAARYTPVQFAAGALTGAIQLGGATEDTVKVLVRRGAKLEPATAPAGWPEAVLRRGRRNALADLIRYVIDNGGDDAEPNSTAPEALATRVALVDEFERLAAAFAVGDKVVIEGLKAKPKYNGKAAVVRGHLNARGRFPVTVAMRDGPETIALKVANLRIAADAA